VDELLEFWFKGVFYSRTALYEAGRLVRAALVPLVCDLPAARQTAGFGGHAAKYFCSMCKLLKSDMDELDMSKWGERTCDEHRADAQAWKDLPTVSKRETAFKLNSTRWSALLDLPYWDPIKYTVIDSMHNHYLGLLKYHCRTLWGMNVSAVDADSNSPLEDATPSEEDIARGLAYFETGTEDELSTCTRATLNYMCSLFQIPRKKHSKAHMIRRILQFVSAASAAKSQAKPANTRNDLAAADRSFLSGNSASTLDGKYNVGVFEKLCEKYQVDVGRNKKETIRNLIAWHHGLQCAVTDVHLSSLQKAKSAGGKAKRKANLPPAILGRKTLRHIQEQLPLTELPSWVDRVPTNVGSTERGKLSADQWHILCVINLPIILINYWHSKSELHRERLKNYMYLVTEVVVGSLLEMTEEAVHLYEDAAMKYLQTAKEVYDMKLTPNHHNSLHIPYFLRLFGPLHSVRTFFSERTNYRLQSQDTNMKFGELEPTYMRQSSRSANLLVFLQDDRIQGEVQELFEAFEDMAAEDRRGTRLRESSSLGDIPWRKQPRKPLQKITLSDECFSAHIAYLNRQAGREQFIDARQIRRIPGTQQLKNTAHRRASLVCGGVSFRGVSDSPRDSNLVFRSPSSPSVHMAGRIQQIFSFSYPGTRGDSYEATYLYVTPLKDLSAADVLLDIYREYPVVGGQLYYDKYLPGIIITPDEVVSHFARTPMK
ncbi:hypothetical protein OH76DRAFT_1298403, partial [Lentinus brumalis]